MSLFELLRRARTGRARVLHQFLLNSSSPDAVHAFFEGKTDESFFAGFLRSSLARARLLYTYQCGGKREVYALRAAISGRHREDCTTVFFVDKDLDDLVPETYGDCKDVYVTAWYSVENYLVTEGIVERVWAEIFRQASGGEEFEQVRASFVTALERFQQWNIEIAAWALFHMHRGVKPQVNNIDLKRLFRINRDLTVERVVKSEDLPSVLDRWCRVDTGTEWCSGHVALVGFLTYFPAKEIVRGKSELWFLVQFLRRLREILQASNEAEGRRFSVPVEITERNAIDVLGPRVEMPSSLRNFIDKLSR